ncbi:cobaltochelatase subunit CobN [Methylobrevis albus]|uniref:Cobaltochelatase subunit CobN n=1 Tax=Methylobrevis albus TaxID=2793297 RepID=A0A931HZ46_9HYPH|nr:cobaltochelatase subunit CobN [Methylobrevis albus]MBH0236281.1 cobaltochelatase subunit CobN [Methylobrevis albus]
MHVLAEQIRSLDDTVQAVDLGQSPAELVILSFSDSDLALLAGAHEAAVAGGLAPPTLRLARIADLLHPYSVDLYVESVAARSRLVIVRCLGGLDYWRYGVDELAAAARRHGVMLAVVPGDYRPDPRLDAASTLPEADLRRIWGWFQHGGPDNAAAVLSFANDRLGRPAIVPEPAPMIAAGRWLSACRAADAGAPAALVVCYRSVLAAGDGAPVAALADALLGEGFAVTTVYVTSLKDPAAVAVVAGLIAETAPAVVLNTTAFSARQDDGGTVLDRADVPVLQVALATTFHDAWTTSARGLGAADFAMNVVLPEVDGRLIAGAASFKSAGARSDTLQFSRVTHRPEPDGIAHAAALAAGWARLGRAPRAARRLALVLSDYPAKGGRTAYAVGLDGPASIAAIADDLRRAGYDIAALPEAADLIRGLEARTMTVTLPLADYARLFAALPDAFRAAVETAWGRPEADAAVAEGAFRLAVHVAGKLAIAVQPDRGRRAARAGDYHDPNLAPSHGYVAFHLWLRHVFAADAMIHLGTHGTLEWLPGKAVALTATCAPRVLTGALPVIYPFIVNNPGEAAQAKRRIAALTLGHLTPPLVEAGLHGAAAEIEALLDEFAQAQTLDPRRASRLADSILDAAAQSGLAADGGLTDDLDRAEKLARLDAWLCDVKDMRIGDGLHVFARPAEAALRQTAAAGIAAGTGRETNDVADLLHASASAERDGLLAALDGRFVAPGPAGAPARGRLDVLPTGRNLYTVDPRQVPTRTAWEIGRRTAEEVVRRYAEDHGDWPRRIVIDLWGSATMRTGGDDLAQAFALLGVRPVWDPATARVSGFEVISPARLGRPRVDVTLRISGLFRDVFEPQIRLFDSAVGCVAALDEAPEDNPLAANDGPRVFGTAPGAYGVGIGAAIATDAFEDRAALGAGYLAASGFSYGRDGEGIAADAALAERIQGADAFVHVHDLAGQDVLDADAFAEHTGGFAAAATSMGRRPALYHVDATRPEATKVRTLEEEISRVVAGRATNPRWLAGQMRHGHRGAAEIAETIGNLFAFAATTDAVPPRAFDRLFDATLGDEAVRRFMLDANPAATQAAARSFDAAIRRGYWPTRRNSVAGRLAEVLGPAAEAAR